MRTFLIIILALCLSACGSDDSESQTSIFSLWSNQSGSWPDLDLTGGTYNAPLLFELSFESGAICQCTLEFTGNESAGTFQTSSCAYLSGGSGDPGCTAFQGIYNYQRVSGSVLEACGPDDINDCSNWNLN